MNKKALLAGVGVGVVLLCLSLLIAWTTIKQRRYVYHYPDRLKARIDAGEVNSISLGAGDNGIVPRRYFLISDGNAPVVIAELDESHIVEQLKCQKEADFINSNGQVVRTYGRYALGFVLVDDRVTSFSVGRNTGVAVGSDFSDQSSELPMKTDDLYRIFGEPSSVERIKRRPWYHN